MAVAEGDRSGAEQHLQAAFEAGFRDRWLLLYDPRLAALRPSPMLDALQQQMADEFARLRTDQAGDGDTDFDREPQ